MIDGDAGEKRERTLAFAAVALRQIKALRQPAEPRDYELWYTYATGYNPSLNKAVNDALARKGNLSPAEVHAIHDTYFGSARSSERIESVGAQVADEIDQVMAMIDSAVGTTTSYSETLADATSQLGRSVDRESLRAIVEGLVQTTQEFERHSQALEQRLKASRREILELQQDLEMVRHESLTDPLTTLANRKYFDHAIDRIHAAANAGGKPMSLMMIDIDHFKSFNDTYGHLTGDQVLRLVALCVKQNVKGQDVAARYGGEEFAVILPDTCLRDARAVAEHIRRTVMGKERLRRSTGENLGRVTISMGLNTNRPGETVQQMIERADACLYAAKRAGRNQAVRESDPAGGLTQSRVA